MGGAGVGVSRKRCRCKRDDGLILRMLLFIVLAARDVSESEGEESEIEPKAGLSSGKRSLATNLSLASHIQDQQRSD
jgi:hypothetical protein